MQFNLIEIMDTGFTFRDPLMLGGLIYACVWLLLSAVFFTAIAVIRRRGQHPYSRERVIITLLLYLLVWLHLPSMIVLLAVNITAADGFFVGMIGGPPIWIAAITLVLGVGLGLALSIWKTSAAMISGLISRREKTLTNSRNDAVPAAVLSLALPGIGQVFREQFITGLGLLTILCTASPFVCAFSLAFGKVTFLILYFASVLGAIFWRNDRFW